MNGISSSASEVKKSILRLGREGTNIMLRLRPGQTAVERLEGAFAIAHAARCGSTVLGKMLDQHPDIRFDGETFGRHLRAAATDGQTDFTSTDAGVLLRRQGELLRGQTFGFDFHRGDLRRLDISATEVIETLQENRFQRFVVLRRDNLLARETSAAVAHSMGRWHLPAGSQTVAPTVELDVAGRGQPTLAARFRSIETYFDEIESAMSAFEILHLSYEEDIKADPNVAFEKVVRFLELPTFNATVSMSKISQKPLGETIANFDHVRSHLTGTEFEWMLNG